MGETKDGFQPAVFQDRIKLELRRKAGVLGVGWGGGRLLGVFLFSPASADPRKAPTSLRMDRGRGRPRGDGEWTWLLSPKLATGPDRQVSSSYWGNTGRSALCTPVVSFFSKSCTMPILISLGKAKASACCVHIRNLTFQFLSGASDCKDAWTPGQGGRKEKRGGGGEKLCAGSALGERVRDQRAEKPLLCRGHKGHKPARGWGVLLNVR